MELITKLLSARDKLISAIVLLSEKYFETISEFVLGMDPGMHKKFLQTIASLKLPLVSLLSADILGSLRDIYITIDDINVLLGILLNVINDEKYLKLTMYNLSRMTANSVTGLQGSINGHIQKINNMAIVDDELIFEAAFTLEPPTIKFILDAKIVNKFIIAAIKRVSMNDPAAAKSLKVIIEDAKNKLLRSVTLDLDSYPSIQAYISSHGLIPATQSMPPEDLFKLIISKGIIKGYDYDTTADLITNCQRSNHAFVILDKASVATPIEFNINGIINSKYILDNNLVVKDQAGLNKKFITRFTTVKRLNDHVPTNVRPVKIGTGASIIVLETLDGKLWRVLGSEYAKLITTNNLFNGLSLRPHEYNTWTENALLAHIDETAPNIIRSFTEVSSSIVSAPLVTEIVSGAMNMYDSTDTPVSTEHFINTVNGIDYMSIIAGKLVHKRSNVAFASEFAVTYVAKLDSITNTFLQELRSQVGKVKIDDRLFDERTGEDLREYLRAIALEIITNVVKELDRANLWADYNISIKEYFMQKKMI